MTQESRGLPQIVEKWDFHYRQNNVKMPIISNIGTTKSVTEHLYLAVTDAGNRCLKYKIHFEKTNLSLPQVQNSILLTQSQSVPPSNTGRYLFSAQIQTLRR